MSRILGAVCVCLLSFGLGAWLSPQALSSRHATVEIPQCERTASSSLDQALLRTTIRQELNTLRRELLALPGKDEGAARLSAARLDAPVTAEEDELDEQERNDVLASARTQVAQAVQRGIWRESDAVMLRHTLELGGDEGRALLDKVMSAINAQQLKLERPDALL